MDDISDDDYSSASDVVDDDEDRTPPPASVVALVSLDRDAQLEKLFLHTPIQYHVPLVNLLSNVGKGVLPNAISQVQDATITHLWSAVDSAFDNC